MIDNRMTPGSGSLKLTGFASKLTHTVITKAIKKNWWVIALYVIVNIGGIVVDATSWVSLATSLGVAIVSTVVGYYMMSEVVTITNEVR
jgi:hypothetical protein